MIRTMTHGNSADCPNVQRGEWSRCFGHEVDDEKVADLIEVDALVAKMVYVLVEQTGTTEGMIVEYSVHSSLENAEAAVAEETDIFFIFDTLLDEAGSTSFIRGEKQS